MENKLKREMLRIECVFFIGLKKNNKQTKLEKLEHSKISVNSHFCRLASQLLNG